MLSVNSEFDIDQSVFSFRSLTVEIRKKVEHFFSLNVSQLYLMEPLMYPAARAI